MKFKDTSEDYSVFLRPNYEFQAFLGWSAASLGLYYTSIQSGLPTEPTYTLMGVSALFAANYARRALKIKKIHKELSGTDMTFTNFKKLRKLVEKNPEHVWWGKGFIWSAKHTQIAFEIVKDGQLAGMTDISEQNEFGQKWIDGIHGGERADVVQSLKHTEGHTLITGTTGSGKTRMFDVLIAQCIARGEGVIIIDPKGDKEMAENAKYACEQMGVGHKFVSFHPAFPEKSVRFNPLKNFTRPTELASRISNLIISSGGDGEAFKSFAWDALNKVIQIFDMLGEKVTLVILKRYLEDTKVRLGELAIRAVEFWAEKNGYDSFKNDLSEFERKMAVEAASGAGSFGKNRALTPTKADVYAQYFYEKIQPFHPSSEIEGLLSMYKHDATHFGKMVSNLLPIMSMIATGSLGPLLSPDPYDDDERDIVDTAMIIREKLVCYVGLDTLSDSTVGAAIGSLMLSDLATVAGARYNFGVGEGFINVFVDEAAEVVNDSFIQLLNKGRGAKLRLWVATQTFADFSARLGSTDKARQVLGNCNNKISLRIVDSETQEFLVKDLPTVNIKTRRLTQGTSAAADTPLSFGSNISESLVEQESPLVQPSFLGMLPNLEYFAILSGGTLFKGKLPIIMRKE